LPCYTTKEGYFNTDSFHQWLVEDLLPHCNPYPGPNSIIVLDNASSYCNEVIANAIRAKGYLVRYLPPYSPEYSPIELSFSVLKAWVRRRFHDLWPSFEGSFGDFLLMCVRRSRCDRFAEAHFRHSGAGGYIFNGDMEKFERELRAFGHESSEGELEI
jgi:transposase